MHKHFQRQVLLKLHYCTMQIQYAKNCNFHRCTPFAQLSCVRVISAAVSDASEGSSKSIRFSDKKNIRKHQIHKTGFFSKFPTETPINRDEIGLKTFFGGYHLIFNPIFQNLEETFFLRSPLFQSCLPIFTPRSYQILTKNIRFAPESKLHQIYINSIRHLIASQKRQI